MNVNKCCYTIFCQSTKITRNLKLTMNEEAIPYEKNPKLLGTVFDEYLSFKKQSDIIKDKCIQRLNVIKILSHASWRLNSKILSNIYKLLIGSIFDYYFFTTSSISKASLNKFQVIQNKP